MDKVYVKYNHHGNYVSVQKELKGEHREFCLCFNCTRFNMENREKNCPIANLLYRLDVALKITTPVWECPNFVPVKGAVEYDLS